MMLTAVCAISLAFLAEVELRGEILHLGDVADLSSLPSALSPRLGRTALLRIDRDALHTVLPRDQLAAQVRARLPILAGCLGETGNPVVIRRRIAETTPRVMAADAAGVVRGEKVGVRIVSGPFAIERSGLAANDARPGGRLFVRTGNGQVVRAVVEGKMP
jgi:hypothetical protein